MNTSYTKLHYFLYSLPIALWGHMNDSAYSIILAEVFFAVLCVYSDYIKGAKYISFITIYSLFTLSYCYGNFLVVKSIGTPEEAVYDYYLVKETIPHALFFTYIANVFCVLGFTFYQQSSSRILFPVMRIDIHPKKMRYIAIALTVLNGMVLISIIQYITLFPFIIVGMFFLTRYATRYKIKWLLNICILNVVVLSINGLLYNYLRMYTVAPSIAFLIAFFFGSEDVLAMFKKTLLPIYSMVIISIIIFPMLGQVRNTSSGFDKLNNVVSNLNEKTNEQSTPDLYAEEKESFEARVSNINQTSQVVKLVNEVGYYKGSTLAYLSYAFIPRFIWKEKPIIAQGVWFALEIGQAYVHADGKVNNSVNMTSAGELYLNFGILGVIVGMFLIGILCAFMWRISGFSESSENIIGAMFGLYLFFLATSTFGIDLQFLVTLISYFCMFQFVNYMYILFFKPKPQTHA